jgi:GNAT superfamily N-acetyltransferase
MIELSRAGPDDTDAIAALMRSCFPANPKARADVLRWQYWENPLGPARSWLARDGDEIVGHYCGVPVPLIVAGREMIGAVGIDAATAPSHRGQGIFDRLLKALYDDVEAVGWDAVLAFPNDKSLRGFEKAGGVSLADFAVSVAAVDVGALAARAHIPRALANALSNATKARRGARGARGARGEEVASIPDDADPLWLTVTAATALGLRRDPQWQRWRYERSPLTYRFFEFRQRGQLRAFCVTTNRTMVGLDALHVLDLSYVDPADGAVLLRSVRSVTRPAAIMVIAAPRFDPQWSAIKKGRMIPVPRRVLPSQIHFGVARARLPALMTPEWSLPWGVLDHL